MKRLIVQMLESRRNDYAISHLKERFEHLMLFFSYFNGPIQYKLYV